MIAAASSRTRRLAQAVVIGAIALSPLVGARYSSGQTGPSSAVPTFNAQVAPVLFASCGDCHRPEGIAPFSLLTYADASARAGAIARATGARAMPPWFADPQYGTFKNNRGLTDAQIELIRAWAAGGAPEGTGKAPTPPVAAPSGWRMNRPPDQILELPFDAFELPASGELPAFTVWMKPFRDERFVQAIEIKPSLQGAVHHSSLSLGTMPPGTRIGRAEAFPGGPMLDGVAVQRNGEAFHSAGGEHIAEKPVMFYVPGGGLLQFPDGLAKRFGRDDFLSWGLHLISRGQVEQLRVQVGLWFAKRYPHHEVLTWTVTEGLAANGVVLPVDGNGERVFPPIPAGASNWSMTGQMRVTRDITIHALWPHMHYRGKDMSFVVTAPNGRQETILSVPHYNPHWQLTYELAKPLKVRRGSVITAFGHFDNSAANPHNPDPTAVVKFGPQGTDEMYLPFLEVTVDDADLRMEQFAQP